MLALEFYLRLCCFPIGYSVISTYLLVFVLYSCAITESKISIIDIASLAPRGRPNTWTCKDRFSAGTMLDVHDRSNHLARTIGQRDLQSLVM